MAMLRGRPSPHSPATNGSAGSARRKRPRLARSASAGAARTSERESAALAAGRGVSIGKVEGREGQRSLSHGGALKVALSSANGTVMSQFDGPHPLSISEEGS